MNSTDYWSWARQVTQWGREHRNPRTQIPWLVDPNPVVTANELKIAQREIREKRMAGKGEAV